MHVDLECQVFVLLRDLEESEVMSLYSLFLFNIRFSSQKQHTENAKIFGFAGDAASLLRNRCVDDE